MINWDDFNYDDINWDDLKKYFEGGNTGESYFDPNDWYASGATYSYNDYKEGVLDLEEEDVDEFINLRAPTCLAHSNMLYVPR